MSNQNSEIIAKRKSTVPIRAELPILLHKKVKKHWASMPRDQRFEKAIIEVLKKGIEALNL